MDINNKIEYLNYLSKLNDFVFHAYYDNGGRGWYEVCRKNGDIIKFNSFPEMFNWCIVRFRKSSVEKKMEQGYEREAEKSN